MFDEYMYYKNIILVYHLVKNVHNPHVNYQLDRNHKKKLKKDFCD